MKGKFVVLFLLFTSVVGLAEIKQDTFKRARILEAQFGGIRAEIARSACSAFSYNNDAVLKEINPTQLTEFYNALTKDPKCNRALVNCLGNVPAIPNNGDLEECKKAVNTYLDQVKNGCKGKDTTWVPDIRKEIQALVEQCICFDKGDTAIYHSAYPRGLFAEAFIVEKPKQVEATPQRQGITETGVTASKAKKTWPQIIKYGGKWMWPLIVFVLATLSLGWFVFILKRKKEAQSKIISEQLNEVGVPTPESLVPENTDQPGMTQSEEPASSETSGSNGPEKPGEVISAPSGSIEEKTEWLVLGASVKGNGHIQSNMPCQDSNKFESIGDGWGIALVSDGAGSATHSEVGSKIVVERGIIHFKHLIEKEGWKQNGVLPTDAEWLQKSYYTLKRIRDEVELVANKNEVEFKSLSATCLVVIYTPIGLLAAHVGDGRMGYKTKSGGWKSMMTPHKGAEANQTIFLISDFWSYPNYVMSGVLVPESIVIREPVEAFALMSDGCENTSWQCTIQDPETGRFYDRNKPFEGFFNPLEETVLSFIKEGVLEDERQVKWRKFIESGTKGFVREQDDKTMIYGVNVNLCK